MNWDILESKEVKKLERLIVNLCRAECGERKHKDFDTRDYHKIARERKKIIDAALEKQLEELLPYIVAFDNEAKKAMNLMFEQGQTMFRTLNKSYPDKYISVEGCCFMDGIYPKDHPIQGRDRQYLFKALTDEMCTNMYPHFGINIIDVNWDNGTDFSDPDSIFESDPHIYDFEGDNWNDGLDRDITKDVHLSVMFHNLYDHTNLAISDYIFVRRFYSHFETEILPDEDCV